MYQFIFHVRKYYHRRIHFYCNSYFTLESIITGGSIFIEISEFKNTSFNKGLRVIYLIFYCFLFENWIFIYLTSFSYCRTYNPSHNILVIYNVLELVQFITRRKKLDIFYNKLGIRIASRVALWLKT